MLGYTVRYCPMLAAVAIPVADGDVIAGKYKVLGLLGRGGMGLVHRDLKPSNLFLTERPDDRWFVKVLDFGISKLSEEHGGEGITTTADVLGTPAYMSPELIRSAKLVDARTDIWALGLILA